MGFNPYRVFSGLATPKVSDDVDQRVLFQSLSGFLRPCNVSTFIRFIVFGNVSIPIGFSQALQRYQ